MTHRSVLRPARIPVALIATGALLLGACSSPSPNPSASSSAEASADESASPSPTPSVAPETPPPLASGPDALALELVVGGFASPTAVTSASDGSDRLFVVEREGRIHVVQPDGTRASTPFLDIVSRVLSGGERGLLGLAFHPDHEANGRLFVAYTRRPDGANVIAEYHVTGLAGQADPASERVLIAVPDPAANHNGGALAFGPDGYLYISMGDGGGQNDQYQNAQNLNSLLGKILRIDVDPPRAASPGYYIPTANPFAAGGGAPEIWAIGMRNPWRISFDREWGDLFMGDVGGGSWEEIDRQPADAPGGLNYGWPVMEGRHCLSGGCAVTGFVQPIAEYDHSLGCSVIGGYVYRGTVQPELEGVYIFADWCSGLLFTLQVDEGTITPKVVLSSGMEVSSFGESDSGEIYLVDFAGGGLYHVVVP